MTPAGGLIQAEAVRVLDELNDTAKSRQAFLKGCGDAAWIDDEQRRAIRWLLSALVEHRRRLRTAARIWRAMGHDEPAGRALVAATADLLDENRSFAPFVAQWRDAVVVRLSMERDSFWRSMLELAEANLVDTRDGAALHPADRRRG
ncbi:uncharacterized protein RMCC_6224 [Mycolicibacterium canariasense]|uniref:Uncharacterized protein n=1 Tax=Mycolicibacterium canariasense TaxID=228230 RepID=A0A124E397_MYCCR|nr:hypothetical protein [Mycolicibacterium canariasense]MCV7207998.1 hypothetical protein [Mycolicibacterium canariasense]ORV11133.1 hypothetical protein AWB94_06245 [Mycolicibacterium canariasense]GAS99259.1 uncharacterized protein RMCC_6224 [Mycolicibacterium canariasense]